MKFPEKEQFIMNEDEILQTTKSVIQTLDTLKKEYGNVLDSSSQKYLDLIDLGNQFVFV